MGQLFLKDQFIEGTIDAYFDFCEWEDAFKLYFKCESEDKYPNLRLVISTESYTSGYWIENRTKELKEGTGKAYSGKEVYQLYERVAGEIKHRETYGGGGLIL